MSYIERGNGPSLVACTVVPFVVTWAFSSVRIYVRRFVLKLWMIEDWLFLGSQICFSVLCICALLATIYGNGQHLRSVEPQDVITVMKYWYTSELVYVVCAFLTRLSIGFFLLRICTSKVHIWIIRCTMVLMGIVSATFFVWVVCQCQPVNWFWLRFGGGSGGTCFASKTIANVIITLSVFIVVADLIFGVLPIFVIWNLKMNRKTKCIIGGLLTLGIIAGLSVIVRIVYVNSLSNPEEDFTFLTFKVAIWSIVEPAIGICCMAISTYRPLFKSLRDKISHNSRSRLTGVSNGNSYPLRRKSKSRSQSKRGFMRTGSVASNTYEDVMGLDMMQRAPSVSGGRGLNPEEEMQGKEGILYSTTVEVTRSPKREDDFV